MRFSLINAFDGLAISLSLCLLVHFCNHRRRRALSYPPGPPLWPIIGNFLDIPKEKPWIAYADMSKKYGRRIALGYMGSTQLKPCVPR